MTGALRLFVPASSVLEQREQLVEIYKNLRSQVPLLHSASLVNLIGLHVATSGQELTLFHPITALTAFLIWRLLDWMFFQKELQEEDEIRKELLKTFIFTSILCVGFSIWAQVLFTAYPDKTMIILLYSVLGALGVAYGLSSFPYAAILPLVVLGLPVSLRVMFVESPYTMNVGVSVLLVLLLMIRLLHSQGRTLERLVDSRLSVAKEHNRAISAEVAALKRADFDVLTGLANRGKLLREIRAHIAPGKGPGEGSVLAFIDLDGFKTANDAFGHAAGDAILETIAKRLRSEFSGKGVVARVGGDEFAIFWADGLPGEEMARTGERICELASEPIAWNEKSLSVGVSCGLTEAGPHTGSEGEFLRQADSALYRVKTSGRGAWRLYDEPLFKEDQRKATLERLLIDTKVHEELTVVFQPIVSVKGEETLYLEALARWQHDTFGEVSPSEFIQLAERLGSIGQLNDALLCKAIAQAKQWPGDITLSFNLSALQINHSGAAQHLLDLLEREDFPPGRIMFEVTETAFMGDLSAAKVELKSLREAGCSIALDDFGSGHASVSYLTDLVVDVVKLDGSLLAHIHECARSRQILLGLVNLCHAAGAKCVAEHVETEEQLVLLKAMGCDFAQGFHLGRPSGASDLLTQGVDASSGATASKS